MGGCGPPVFSLRGEEREELTRYLVKTGNRGFVDLDFRWVLETDIVSRTQPAELAMVERATNGSFYGWHTWGVKEDGRELTQDLHPALQRVLARANDLSEQANELQKGDIGSINYQLGGCASKSARRSWTTSRPTAQGPAGERAPGPERSLSGAGKRALLLRAQADRDSITVKGHAWRAGDHAHVQGAGRGLAQRHEPDGQDGALVPPDRQVRLR